jgi:hypothetical protein
MRFEGKDDKATPVQKAVFAALKPLLRSDFTGRVILEVVGGELHSVVSKREQEHST